MSFLALPLASYQYLARRYGLNLRSVHWEPEAVPNPQHWAELERLLGVVFDPCANRPANGDFLNVMRHNAGNLRRALR